MGHKKNKYFRSAKGPSKEQAGVDQKKKPKQYQPRIETDEELIDQVLQVQHLLSISRNKLNNSQHHCYLLSAAWLRSWKEYTGYAAYLNGQSPQESPTFGRCRPEPANSDIAAKGPSDYIELPKSLEEYNYLSTEVDPSAELNKDFTLVDADLWYYFEAKYTGKKILRPIKRTKGKAVKFDIDLTDLKFVALPDEAMLHMQELDETTWKSTYEELVPIHKLQVPSFWTLTDLREFAAKYLKASMNFGGSPADIEFWKFESLISEKDIKISLVQTVRKKNYNFLGRILAQEEKDQFELTDFIKSSYVLFIRFGQIAFRQVSIKSLPVTGQCEGCLGKHSLDVTCGCKKVLYCSRKCAAEDKSYHQRICHLAYDSDDDEQYEQKYEIARDAKCGFSNLGNTCYMNSALQCLSNLSTFSQYFQRNLHQACFDKKEYQVHRGIFLKKLSKLLKKYNGHELIAPWSIKTQINHFLPQFRGYDQHDASEFVLALLNIVNDSLEKISKEHGYSDLLCNTFLGEFQSKICCPYCKFETDTREPFLSVPLSLKEKEEELDEYEYVVVESWRKYRKGIIPTFANWSTVAKTIGIDESMKRLVGVEGCELMSVSYESTLGEIARKNPKEEIVFYPNTPPAAQDEIDIQVGLAYMHNQAKTPCGYPLIVRTSLSKSLYEIYFDIMSAIGTEQEARQKIEALVLQASNKYEQETTEKGQNRVDAQLIENFQQNYSRALGFEVIIVSNRRAKKGCIYCHRKCAWCVLPFSLIKTVEDYISLGQKPFRLEIVFNDKLELEVTEKVAEDKKSNMVSLQDCIELFSQPETLDEENFWFCVSCQAPRLATKILQVSRIPNILMFQLKRFREQGGHKVKNNEPVSYPQLLNFQGVPYRFNSAIVHEGSLEGGHYWAICRKNDGYWTFNDDTFKPAEGLFSPNAYVLFYERV